MKNIFVPLMALCAILWSCGTTAEPNHDHATCDGTHEHPQGDSHDHAAEEGHAHQGEHNHAAEAAAEATAEEHDHEGEGIKFSDAQAKASGVTTTVVQAAPFASSIKVGGQIVSASGDLATVAATTSGIVTFANRSFAPGQAVSRGQVVAYLNSAKVEQGDAVARAKAQYATAQSAYERGVKLAADNIISQKDLEQLKLAFQSAKIAYDAFGVSTSAGVSVTAPIGGYVKNILVSQGDYVAIGSPIATIVQNKRIQLRADVPQRHFNIINSVKSANFVTTYDDKSYNTTSMNGRLISQGKALDGTSFYVPIIFEMDNVGDIVPGSFVEVFLLTTPSGNSISVAKEAIVEQQGIYYVFVKSCQELYSQVEVKLGNSNGSNVEILSGLHSGDEVVTTGAMQVKLASISTSIPDGHGHSH